VTLLVISSFTFVHFNGDERDDDVAREVLAFCRCRSLLKLSQLAPTPTGSAGHGSVNADILSVICCMFSSIVGSCTALKSCGTR